MFARGFLVVAIPVALILGGCGLYVPDVVPSREPNADAFLTNRIVNHIKCELRDAVFKVIDYDKKNARLQRDHRRRVKWLETWGAYLTLNFTVVEKGSFNPGVTYTKTFPNSDIFSIGGGASLSSEATHIEKVDYFLSFADDFIAKRHEFINQPQHCVEEGGILIDSDLKIQDWLWSKLFPYFLPENINSKPPKTLSDEVTFVVVASGNVTPTWKLVRLTATGSPLFDAKRSNTDDLIITLGPEEHKQPSAAVMNSHFASQVGSAVTLGIERQ